MFQLEASDGKWTEAKTNLEAVKWEKLKDPQEALTHLIPKKPKDDKGKPLKL